MATDCTATISWAGSHWKVTYNGETYSVQELQKNQGGGCHVMRYHMEGERLTGYGCVSVDEEKMVMSVFESLLPTIKDESELQEFFEWQGRVWCAECQQSHGKRELHKFVCQCGRDYIGRASDLDRLCAHCRAALSFGGVP